MDQKNLIELNVGENVYHFLLKKRAEIKKTKSNKNYLDLELGDKSAAYSAKVWDNFEKLNLTDDSVKVVKVAGEIEDFQGRKQIKIAQIRAAEPSDKVEVDDFMPRSKRDFEQMKKEFFDYKEQISNPYLNQLLKLIFTEENLAKYFRAPAGKAWHHAYLHGLLEHTLEILKICDLMCNIHDEINKDILICGILLHDFGKIEELKSNENFDYTDKGQLLGHIVIASNYIEKYAAKIEGFPEDLKNQIIHLVLSHQGKLEFASPVVPKTLEAIVLHHADELSAKTNAYKNKIEEAKANGQKWTDFVRLIGTPLYAPEEDDLSSGLPKDTLFD